MKKYQHYIDARGEVLPTPHRNNDSCCNLLIIWKTDPSEIEITYNYIRKQCSDSVLLSLFMRTNGKCNNSHPLDTGLSGIMLLMVGK